MAKGKKKKGRTMSPAQKQALAVGRAIVASKRTGVGGGGGRHGAAVKASTRKAAKKAIAKRPAKVKKAAKKAAAKAERRGNQSEKALASSTRNLAKAQSARGNKKAATALKAESEAVLATPGPARTGRKKGSKKSKSKRGVAAAPKSFQQKIKTTKTTTKKNKSGGSTKTVKENTLVLNPKSMKNMDVWGYASGIAALAVGFVSLGVLHAYVVNRTPKGGKHPYIGKDATLRQMAKPTTAVYLSGAGLGVVSLAAAGYARSKNGTGWKIASALLGGLAAAGFLYPTVLFLKHEVAGRMFPLKDGNEISFGNIAFPAQQLNFQASLQQLIDAQDADPAGYIGQVESAPGFGDTSYVYGAANGTPLPGVDGAGGNFGIIVVKNATSGLSLVSLLDPTRGAKPKQLSRSNVSGIKQQWIKGAVVKAAEVSNHAAGCGGNCGKPCCGKDKKHTAEDLLAEAAEFDAMAKTANSTDGVHFRAAAEKLRSDAAALRGLSQNAAAGPNQGEERIRFGNTEYVRADLVRATPMRSAAVAAVPAVRSVDPPVNRAAPELPAPGAPSAWVNHQTKQGTAPAAYVPKPALSRVS